MATMFIRHRVADYEGWKRGYDDNAAIRPEHGVIYASVHRDASDPDIIIVVHRFNEVVQAQAFAKFLEPIMTEMGVEMPPEIWFSEDIAEEIF